MKEITLFREKLQPHLRWNRARLAFVSDFLLSLMKTVIARNRNRTWRESQNRTDWQFGKTVINILMLGAVYKGVAFPLIWTMLDKKGNSNTQERRDS